MFDESRGDEIVSLVENNGNLIKPLVNHAFNTDLYAPKGTELYYKDDNLCKCKIKFSSKVEPYNDAFCKLKYDGQEYYVKKTECVKGIIGSEHYVSDGWLAMNMTTEAEITKDSVIIRHNGIEQKYQTQIIQTVENNLCLKGKTVLLSVLARVRKKNSEGKGGSIAFINANGYNKGSLLVFRDFDNTEWKKISLVARLSKDESFCGLTVCLRALVSAKGDGAEVEFKEPVLHVIPVLNENSEEQKHQKELKRVSNLYFNPMNIATEKFDSSPLYVDPALTATCSNNCIRLKACSEKFGRIIFGGFDGKKGLLSLIPGSFYTVSLKVRLDKVLRIKSLVNALRLCFSYYDNNFVKHEEYSHAVYNEVGIWEESITFFVPENICNYMIAFNIGCLTVEDELVVSDIRITNTDGKLAPFGIQTNQLKVPYYDVIDGEKCCRIYPEHIYLSMTDFIDYLIFAKESDNEFDISMINSMTASNDAYSVVKNLFVSNSVPDDEQLIGVMAQIDDYANAKIAEKLVLLRRFEIVKKLVNHGFVRWDSFEAGIIQVNLLTNQKQVVEADKLLRRLCDKENGISLKGHRFSKEEICEIVIGLSQNLCVQRIESAKWIVENYNEIKRRADLLSNPQKLQTEEWPIWVYWAQGIENAPEVVKVCVTRMKEVFSNRVKVLSDKNVKYYVASYNIDKISNLAHKSDYIRTELLYRYGGTWIDSTCLVKKNFKDIIDNNLAVFPNYSKDNVVIGNWLLSSSHKKSYFFALLYSTLLLYTEKKHDFNEYFMFHIFFRVLIILDDLQKETWKSSYYINAQKAIAINNSPKELVEIWDDNRFREAVLGSPILKLTYKYEALKEEINCRSNIARLFRGEDLL